MHGNFPGTPIWTYPMSDDDWEAIREKGDLPDVCSLRPKIIVYSTRAYLDRMFEHARCRNEEFRQSLKLGDLRTTVSRLANSTIGAPLIDVIGDDTLQAQFRARLRGAALILTRDFGSDDYARLATHIEYATSVTHELKVLARIMRILGAGSRSDLPTGGSHDEGERVFLSELLNFWRFRLGRSIAGQKWINSRLISFVQEAFLLALGKSVNPESLRQRLHRILPLMDRAEKDPDLDWNVLSERLKKNR